MAESYSASSFQQLNIGAEYRNSLSVDCFSQMLKDPSYCYKYYWLEALVKIISTGKTETTFNEIINEMICNAWYSVQEFHIHLSGMPSDAKIRDGLERAVILLKNLSGLPANASKDELLNAIAKYDEQLKQAKTQLTHMVPYRALAGFFQKENVSVSWESPRILTSEIQQFNDSRIVLPYTFGDSSSLSKEVHIHPLWAQMIQDYTAPILGWIQFEKIKWLQTNNPEVPNLMYKLTPLDEKIRKLGKVHKLWDAISEIQAIEDVYTGKLLDAKSYDMDHFIPWSFVMNDELWNLMPMDSSLNSAKSNRLPQWDPFFRRFSDNQYKMYEMIHKFESIYRLYENCCRDNLHSIWAMNELYRPGNTKQEFAAILQKNMRPVYDSARRQGYDLWRYGAAEKGNMIWLDSSAGTVSMAAEKSKGYRSKKDKG